MEIIFGRVSITVIENLFVDKNAPWTYTVMPFAAATSGAMPNPPGKAGAKHYTGAENLNSATLIWAMSLDNHIHFFFAKSVSSSSGGEYGIRAEF